MWNNETLVIKRVDPGLYKIVDSKKAIRRIVGKDFLYILYLQLNDFTECICKTTSGLYIIWANWIWGVFFTYNLVPTKKVREETESGPNIKLMKSLQLYLQLIFYTFYNLKLHLYRVVKTRERMAWSAYNRRLVECS